MKLEGWQKYGGGSRKVEEGKEGGRRGRIWLNVEAGPGKVKLEEGGKRWEKLVEEVEKT